MILRKIPQAGTIINMKDLLSGFTGLFIDQQEKFIKELKKYFPSEYTFLVNSGSASFYIILKILKENSSKNEVVLPVCTASSMVLPVLKLGLKPVLCDISKNNFNIDLQLLPKVVNNNTLCIVPAHMFGLAVTGIENLKKTYGDISVVEDCAQSMGTMIKNKNLGTFGDMGFVSFNRGKNLPTYGGGCIFTNSRNLAEKIELKIKTLKPKGLFAEIMLLNKTAVLSVVTNPYVYGAFFNLISLFKDTEIPKEIFVEKYTSTQAGIGLSLLKKIKISSDKRHENTMFLINGLKDIKGLILPAITNDSIYAFNRLPLIFKDTDKIEKAKKLLFENGIDISLKYILPLHHVFNLGYKNEEFPNANYLTERLLTLPVHSLVEHKDLLSIIGVIEKVMRD